MSTAETKSTNIVPHLSERFNRFPEVGALLEIFSTKELLENPQRRTGFRLSLAHGLGVYDASRAIYMSQSAEIIKELDIVYLRERTKLIVELADPSYMDTINNIDLHIINLHRLVESSESGQNRIDFRLLLLMCAQQLNIAEQSGGHSY